MKAEKRFQHRVWEDTCDTSRAQVDSRQSMHQEERIIWPLWVVRLYIFKTYQTSKAFSTSSVDFLPVLTDPQHLSRVFLSCPTLYLCTFVDYVGHFSVALISNSAWAPEHITYDFYQRNLKPAVGSGKTSIQGVMAKILPASQTKYNE